MTKICTTCRKPKKLSDFYKRADTDKPDKYRSSCKACLSISAKSKNNPVSVICKTCSECGNLKDATGFNKMSTSSDGLRPNCKLCLRARKKAHREANRYEYQKKDAQYYKDNAEARVLHKRKYRALNPEKVSKSLKRWYVGRKKEDIEELKKVTKPNIDGKWLYIMQHGSLVKVGMSDNPHIRTKGVGTLSGRAMVLRYIARPLYGRTVDAESLCHADLADWNIPVTYTKGSVSREWFDRTPEQAAEVLRRYCQVEEIYI